MDNGIFQINHFTYSFGPTSCIWSEYARPLNRIAENHVFAVKGSEYVNVEKTSLLPLRLIMEKREQVFHFHSVHFFLGVIMCFFLGARSVFTVHTSWGNYKTVHKILFTIMVFFSKKVAFVSALSKDSFPKYLQFFLNNKSVVINNAFDPGYLHTERKENIWVVSGRLSSVKRTSLSVDLFLRNCGKSDVLHVIGDGEERILLERKYVQHISSGKIVFHGMVDRTEVLSWLAKARFYLSMSKFEGLPISVLEAVGSGCVCFLSDIPQHSCFKDFRNVRLMDPCQQFIDLNIVNEEEQKNIVEEARKRIRQNFGIKEFVDKYKELYGI